MGGGGCWCEGARRAGFGEEGEGAGGPSTTHPHCALARRPPFIYKFLTHHITRPPKTASGQFGGAQASAWGLRPQDHGFARSIRAPSALSKKTHRGFVAGHLPSTHEGSWPVSFCPFFFSIFFFFVNHYTNHNHIDPRCASRNREHLETSRCLYINMLKSYLMTARRCSILFCNQMILQNRPSLATLCCIHVITIPQSQQTCQQRSLAIAL